MTAARLTPQQRNALARLQAEHIEDGVSENELWQACVTLPRRTMRSLASRGLVRQGDYVDDYSGYMWYLTEASTLRSASALSRQGDTP